MTAKELKERGFSHVLVEITNIGKYPTITKAFKSRKKANEYIKANGMDSPNYINSLWSIKTVDNAIKKGY